MIDCCQKCRYFRWHNSLALQGICKVDNEEKWSCYDCIWATDKCKNKDSTQYNNLLQDIDVCNLTGDVDNSLGCSWRTLGESID